MTIARYHPVVVAVLALAGAVLGAEPAASRPTTTALMWKSIYGTVLHDAKRDKALPVTLHVPDAPGPHPLIVFSHGAGGSGENYNGLTTGWAQRGYVVIAPTHADSISLLSPEERRGMRALDVVRDAVTDAEGWANRVRDVTFILDSLDELERLVPRLAGKVDRDRIGVAGHSYGAHTAQVVAGAQIRSRRDGDLESFADPRVKAALLLSGQGEGQMGLGEGSWAALRVPLMVMTGSEDRGAKGQDPRWRKSAFDHAPPGDKYWVFIEGAAHSTFVLRQASVRAAGGIRARGRDQKGDGDRPPPPNLNAIFGAIQRATNVFWDAHLKGDPQARQQLVSGDVAKDAHVTIEYATR